MTATMPCVRCAPHGICMCNTIYELRSAPQPELDPGDDAAVYVPGQREAS